MITGQEPSVKAIWMMFMNVNLERKASSSQGEGGNSIGSKSQQK